MKVRSIAPMRVAKWGTVVLSALFCVLGVLFIAFPRISAVAVGRALGAAMVVFGGVKIVGYLSKDLYRLAFQYDLEMGVLEAILGAILLVRPEDMLDLTFVTLGIATLADGLFKLRISLDARRFGIPSWGVILGLAIAAVAAGGVLMFLPREGGSLLTVWLGVSLLAKGLLNLWVAVSTVKIIRHQMPDGIDVGAYEIGEEAK